MSKKILQIFSLSAILLCGIAGDVRSNCQSEYISCREKHNCGIDVPPIPACKTCSETGYTCQSKADDAGASCIQDCVAAQAKGTSVAHTHTCLQGCVTTCVKDSGPLDLGIGYATCGNTERGKEKNW